MMFFIFTLAILTCKIQINFNGKKMFNKLLYILFFAIVFPQGYNMDLVGFLDFGQNTSDISL